MGLRGLIAMMAVLTVSLSVSSQEVYSLHERFDKYSANIEYYKFYMNFDQPVYAPGDTAFFVGYLRDEYLQSIEKKVIFNVGIFDFKGRRIDGIRFNTVGGRARNQWIVPSSIPPGRYQVVAYPDWEGDVSQISFFQTEIVIEDDFAVDQKSLSRIGLQVEGGNLVAGVENKVLVNFRGYRGRVSLYDQQQNEIDTWEHMGNLFHFSFVPSLESQYFLKFGNQSIALPEVVQDGLNIQLRAEEDSYGAEIKVPENSTYLGQELSLVQSTRDSILKIFPLSLKAGPNRIPLVLDLKGLIQHLSLVSSDNQVISTRSIYVGNDEAISVKLDGLQKPLSRRSRHEVTVSVNDGSMSPLLSEFQVSLVNQNSFDEAYHRDSLMIQELDSELQLLSLDSDDIDDSYLNQLLVFKEFPIPWQEIFEAKYEPNFSLLGTITKEGRIYSSVSKQLPDSVRAMFYLQKTRWSKEVEVDDNGEFRFWMPDITVDDEIFYVVAGKKGKDLDVNIKWKEPVDPTIKLISTYSAKETTNVSTYGDFTEKNDLINDSYIFFVKADSHLKLDQSERGKEHSRFIFLDDYKAFGTMEELVKEVIPSLMVRKKKKKNNVYVKLEIRTSKNSPFYIIDGVATKDTDHFLNLKPATLWSIEVLKKPSQLKRFGLLGKDGVVIVTSKNKDLLKPTFGNYGKVSGINAPLPRVANSKGLAGPKPIFKPIIFFNDFVETDEKGNAKITLSTSDDVGPMMIVITGITKSGRPFTHRQVVIVE